MKQFCKKCTWILVCLLLAGCGAKSQMVLETSGTEEYRMQEAPIEDSGNGKSGTEDSGGKIREKADNNASGRIIAVYVCGEVKHPGVYELSEGMRICDAVEAAGGFTEKASREYWNLAQVLSDGQMLSVPTREEARKREAVAEEGTSIGAAEEPGKDGLVNINTADAALLTSVPGIGQVRAEAVIAYRKEHGSFQKKEDIKKVSGIGDALFEKMKDHITVS